MPSYRLVDPVTEDRSRLMRAVKSKENASTELAMISILRANGLRGWRRHLPLIGRPDFAWRAEHVALFVDGCFWHGCPVCLRRPPVNNAKFWDEKIASNNRRDRRVARSLRAEGWKVIRVWEHALRSPDAVGRRIARALLAHCSR